MSDVCKCRPISGKRYLKIEASVVVSECTHVTAQSLIKFYVIGFSRFISRGCFNSQNAALVTASGRSDSAHLEFVVCD